MKIRRVGRAQMEQEIPSLIAPTSVVLDIGCGLRPQDFFRPRLHICCEPCDEYADLLSRWFACTDGVVVVKALGNAFLQMLPNRAVDSIFLIDVVEHLTKEDGLALLAQCRRVARRQIALFTPWGFMPQEYEEGAKDGWGFTGAKWQRHLSGWDDKDFDDAWELLVCEDFHDINGKGERMDPPHGAFWAICNIPPATAHPASAEKLAIILPTDPQTDEQELSLLQAFRQPDPGAYALMSQRDYGRWAVRELRQQVAAHAAGAPVDAGIGRFIRLPPVMPQPDTPLPRWQRTLKLPAAWQQFQARIAQYAAAIERAVADEPCHAIVAVIGDPLTLPAASLAARRLNLPLAVYCHRPGMVANWPPQILPSRWLRQTHQQALAAARIVLAADPATAENLRGMFAVPSAVASAADHPPRGRASAALRTSLFGLRASPA